jgi:sugar lactone lactonase YvrE
MHHLSLRSRGVLALCVAAAVGCGSSGPSGPKTGSLTVTITAGDGTTPQVVISGPNAYTKTISSTQTLTGLTVGSYTITADSAVGPDSVVGSIIDTGTVTGSPASVTHGTTATATVSYAMKYRVGGLWIANNNSDTNPDLSANQLRKTGTDTAASLLFTAVTGPAGLAIDASGNMWESSFSDDKIVMYTPAERNAGAGASPSITITSTGITDAECITFDSHGNLWIANRSGGLVAFSAAQLAATGTQNTPLSTIQTGSVLVRPEMIAFDANGNGWVADEGGHHVVELSAAQLAATGTSTPTPIDTIGGPALASTEAVAFDANGNLWVASDNSTNNTLVEYTPAQLTAGGAPTPTTIITLPSSAFAFGMAFDSRGTLWVSDDNNGVMLGYTAAQLATTGTPTPIAVTVPIGGSGFAPEQPAFDPYSTAIGTSMRRVRSPVTGLSRVSRRANPNRVRRAN